jgi:hypothetical protein
MAHEPLKSSSAVRALGDVVGDFADLIQKELRLARAELSANLSAKLHGGMWIAASAALALMAVFLLLQALVFGIASYGVSTHMACLIVAGVVAVLAVLAFALGRADARVALTPQRAFQQMKLDVDLSKEQLP